MVDSVHGLEIKMMASEEGSELRTKPEGFTAMASHRPSPLLV